MYDENIESKKYDDLNFEYFGMLYKGFGLLGAYLNKDQKAIYPYEMIRIRDVVKNFKTSDYLSFDYIGNIIPSNITTKYIDDVSDIKVLDLIDIVEKRELWGEIEHKNRISMLKSRYELFFKGQI